MKKGAFILGIFTILLVIPLVSSAVLIEDDFRSTYSVGDKVELDFSVSSNSFVSDFVDSYLKCDGKSVLIDKRYVFLDNDKKSFSLEFPVLSEGDCRFRVAFRNENDESEEFEISEDIEIEYGLNGKYFSPGEEIIINGTAKKANGDKYSGLINLNIDGLIQKSAEVLSGDFSFSYTIKENARPKKYKLELSVEELNIDEDVLNSGKVIDEVFVNSKPTKIVIETVESFQPPYNLSFKFKLLNQIGELILGEPMIAKIRDYDNNMIYQKEVMSNVPEVLFFPGNSKKGSAYINAYYGGIYESVPVYVEDYEAVSSLLLENVLRFTNEGNVPYEGSVDFEMEGVDGTEKVLINVTIPIGGTYDYDLKYTGVYNITSEGKNFLNSRLTGAAILGDNGIRTSSLVVIILFVLILVFGYFYVRKKRKEHFPAKEKIEGTPEMVMKIEKEIKTRKVFVNEVPEEKKEVKRDVYMLFIKSAVGIEEYLGIVEKYGSRLHVVDDELGYVIFYGLPDVDSDHKLYKLAKSIKKFSKVKDDNMSLVLNKGLFEKKISLLKKFALINKKLLHAFPGKVVVGDKLMQRVGGHENFEEKVVEIETRRMKVWVI